MKDFKVKCIKAGGSENYEVGKIYYVRGGFLICEDGFGFGVGKFDSDNIDEVNNYSVFYPSYKFELVEDSKVFTKADLKTGDWIVKRNGDLEQVLLNTPFGDYTVAENGSNSLSGKNDNLTSTLGEMFDIMKVMRPNHSGHLGKGNCKDGTVVFDREKGIGCEKPKSEYKFEVGQRVKVSDNGYACDTYIRFVEANANQLVKNFIEGGNPSCKADFFVVGKGKRDAQRDTAYVIQDVNSRQVFVFCEEGLKAVEEDLW